MSDAKHDEQLMQGLSEILIGLLSSGVSRLDREPAVAIMHKIENRAASVRYTASLDPFIARVEIAEHGETLYSFEFESRARRVGWIEIGAKAN